MRVRVRVCARARLCVFVCEYVMCDCVCAACAFFVFVIFLLAVERASGSEWVSE